MPPAQLVLSATHKVAMQPPATPRSSCWTCKARRVGCDRALPKCFNCVRSGRECLGYGLRLKWPETRDGRRKDGEMQLHVLASENLLEASEDYGLHFLNVTDNDVLHASTAGITQVVKYMASTPAAPLEPSYALTTHPELQQQDGVLLSYYERIISPMVSTLRVENGFRSELIPMIMSGSDAAASSLCNAMMAVSAFHQHGPRAALPYKVKAIRSLSESFDGRDAEMPVVQAAAAMMLCVYSVFDEKDGNWHTHLNGAKWLLNTLCRTESFLSEFVMTWFIYHEVMGGFTQPLRRLPLHFSPTYNKLLRIDMDSIVGSVGCSVNIFWIVSQINDLRAAKYYGDPIAKELKLARPELSLRLQNLTQTLHPKEAASITRTRRVEIMVTAELYRLAALIYLYRVCPSFDDDETVATLIEQSFASLDRLRITTSPWPVFVIACECRTDSHRIRIMRVMDTMARARRIGNLNTMRTAIENYWKQNDLQLDAGVDGPTPWWMMFGNEKPVPWFV